MIIVNRMSRSYVARRFPLLRYSHDRGLMAIDAARTDGGNISLHPFIENVKTPGARPGGAASEKVIPDLLCEVPSELRFNSRRPLRQSRRDAPAKGPAEPVFPRKSECAFSLPDNLLGQKIANGLDQ